MAPRTYPCNGTSNGAGHPNGPRPFPCFAWRCRVARLCQDTDYVMTYHKPQNSPELLARSFARKEDRRVSMTLADFLTAAWKLANDRARELGWIV
jgi:hypothetical protein